MIWNDADQSVTVDYCPDCWANSDGCECGGPAPCWRCGAEWDEGCDCREVYR